MENPQFFSNFNAYTDLSGDALAIAWPALFCFTSKIIGKCVGVEEFTDCCNEYR